jgi:hypothetical protein
VEHRKKLLEERERLSKEYTERLKIQVDSFNKRNDLLPKFHNTPDGVWANYTPTMESLAEYDKADKEEREAAAKLRETLEKILEINTKLQA